MKLLLLSSVALNILCLIGPGHSATCGSGNIGDGVCADGTCCSQYGWCGTSSAHCDGYCGGGQQGNGICANGQCCSQYGYCGSTPEYCSNAPGPDPTAAPVGAPVPTLAPIAAPPGEKGPRMIAYVGNWEACPTDSQIEQYSHIMIAFAVTYQWAPGAVICDQSCNIAAPPICNNEPRPDLIEKWHSMGKKVILSFGGATMGGSWLAAPNGCWEYCFGKEEQVVSQLTGIVNYMNLDGVDIDYEYYYENNQGNSGFSKGAEAQKFLKDVTQGLRAQLPDKELLHVPMQPDVWGPSHPNGPTAYYNLLAEIAPALDYVMPQYYNGDIYPYYNMPEALGHYNDVIELFDGDTSKVVFGFCISDCPGFNLNGYQAATIMQELSEAYPCNGGAFFWVASDDSGGSWASVVNQELAIDAAKCSSAPMDPTVAPIEPTVAPVDPTDAPVDPTDAPIEPTAAPVDPTDAPIEPTTAPIDPTDAPVEPTNPPVNSPPNGCSDTALPPAWSGNGAHDCNYYEGHGGVAYCAHEAISNNCCFCGGGAGGPSGPNDPPVEPTNPPVDPTSAPVDSPPDGCTDTTLPPAWGAPCSWYEDHGGTAYCNQEVIQENCCFCGGGSGGPSGPNDPPLDPTYAPMNPTDAPMSPTDAPINPTDAPVSPTDAPVNSPPGGCTDTALPPAWSGNGAHDCSYYEDHGGVAYCAHQAIGDNCCFCGGGAEGPDGPNDPPVNPTDAPVDSPPDTCTDFALPPAWSGNGVHDCSYYENHGGVAYCAHKALDDNCCFCGGGGGGSIPV